jgi:hypothetical protein
MHLLFYHITKAEMIFSQKCDNLKPVFFQIYVLPSIDEIPKSHPHAERINKLVAEEKKKLEDLTEVMGKKGLTTRHIAPEDLAAIHKDPVQSKCSLDKDNISSDRANLVSPDTTSVMGMACSRKMDLGVCNKPPESCISSVSSKIKLGNPEQQQEVKAGNFVPSVGGASPQINSIIRMQTCSQCHELFCRDTLGKVESNGMKIFCKTCTDSLSAAESSSIEETLTLYRCGTCFMGFFERDILASHMDKQHTVPRTSTDKPNADTTVTSLGQGPAMSTDMGMLCPPVNLLLRNVVLQPRPTIQKLPLTFTNQNILLNTAPMFTLQPSVLTPLSQSSAVITPKNFPSGPSMSLPTPAEVSTDPGKVLLPDPVPQVTKPKLDSMNEVLDNNKRPLDGNPVEKTEITKSNNQSSK